MEMDLVGIKNQNEYYTNHYFTSIFKDNAEETIGAWKAREKEEGISLPWHMFRDTSRQYYRVRDRYQYSKNEEQSKPMVQEMAELYLTAMGYGKRNSVQAVVSDELTVPVFHEEVRANGAPLLWAFLCVAQERDEDILQSLIFSGSNADDEYGASMELCNDDILSKLFFAGEEAPRFIILIGINQIALIDRNKWNEKRFLQFNLDDIFSRHSESTFMALTVLLHKESLCPNDGACVLDNLDENSHKHSAGVSEALKYALRECIEILGNEVIYDMKIRQQIDLTEHPVDASELTLECLRYMYRFLFMLFIEARPELGYAPMKSQVYVQGYSLEGLRDVCARVKDASEVVSEGYYICDTISDLFDMIYNGYPGDLDAYKKALEEESLHDVFTIEALKAHIFDPEYTKLITKAKLRNSAMLQIVDLMSISRPSGSRERRGRISYSALGINQMGAVYEALLSYRGFIAEETLFEVKRAGEKFNELDVGYFVPERELSNYKEEERVRVDEKNPKSVLRKYEQGTFIYRLAGREREKSASYYTPEVLTKCLVKYALKELLKDKTADEILNLTICEPAMGSAAFLNEAINQIAEAYLNKRQEETGITIEYDKRFEELQKVKMFIADRNVYGVDLNPIAVELAEVSLWLNTIYKGAYVPWFGTQLVCGNSLIGARRQVYSQSQLTGGKWYDKSPRRVMPGETRTKKGQHEHTKEIYHFLLGDPGMANYTDKVIKGLEPDNIKKIKDWNKEFTKKYDDDDIKTMLRLSEIIDTLWDRTVELRKKVEAATSEPLSVFGHEENMEGSHTSIREKDAIYHRLFKSENMNNAGPYARLKAAMDYWCALWFWPIDKADLLPSRQEFFFEMSLILEGGIQAVNVNTSGQMSLFGDNGEMTYDEEGRLQLHMKGDQLALEFQSQYSDLGLVCLDDLRKRSERLAIANQIAEEQKFQHWELEFVDVFAERGGFDLILGNPPWINITWELQSVVGDYYPEVMIKNYSASDVSKRLIDNYIGNSKLQEAIYKEYTETAATQNFSNAIANYALLKGMQTDLYKCFISKSLELAGSNGMIGFVHPESIFNDPKGEQIRKEILRKMVYHFHFVNELKLFAEVDHHMEFGLNVYSSSERRSFDAIFNLFTPATIESCYSTNDDNVELGIKTSEGVWNISGEKRRIIRVGENEIKVFANVFDGSNTSGPRLPALQSNDLMGVISKIAACKQTIGDISDEIAVSGMWHETNDQKKGLIVPTKETPSVNIDMVCTGPNIGICNPAAKEARVVCGKNSDYDCINLEKIGVSGIYRTKYRPGCGINDYKKNMVRCFDESLWSSDYRIVARMMLNLSGERSLISAIIPPERGHVNGLMGFRFKDRTKMVFACGLWGSLVYDFFVRIMKKSNFNFDTASKLPIGDAKYKDAITLRVLLINAVGDSYKDLIQECYSQNWEDDSWGKEDLLVSRKMYDKDNLLIRNEYLRREVLVELDVLAAMSLGLTLQELIQIYKIQFAVLHSYEDDTWYDQKGKIIFTNNRSLVGIGVQRPEWEVLKNTDSGEVITTKGVSYYAPFVRCNREADYCAIWNTFERRLG